MNFLDSLLDKIPIIRDMNKKKRILAAGFVLFAIVSLFGILIDALASGGGVIALISVALGFLLMAAIIIADFIMSRRDRNERPDSRDQYSFFDDSPDASGYQDETDGYNANDGPEGYYDDTDYGDEMQEDDYRDDLDDGDFQDDRGLQVDSDFRDDRRFREDLGFRDDRSPREDRGFRDDLDSRRFRDPMDFRDDFDSDADESPDEEQIQYAVTPEPLQIQEEKPEPETPRRSRFEFRPTPDNNLREESANPSSDEIGKPVMAFDLPSGNVRNEVGITANAVAPDITPPQRSDAIGGPVMSIPFRGGAVAVSVTPSETERVEPVRPQPIQSAYKPVQPVAVSREERGKEIDEFFDHMSDDEILYSDCVEVWASDAKPAAIRLLKQVEAITDKRIADPLGREAEYVNAMLDRIYYFTMLDSIKDNLDLKKYNFSAMVKECLRRFSPFFMEKRLGLLWKGLDIDIVTDKRWVIFALTQVVFNAVEFTGLGGKIAISAKKEGSMIHLMVDDNGCGISDDDLPHIFMAGFMGDNVPNESGRRTGMGLFITRSVIEKLGGSVTAESTIGKGTRITMILPEKI